ncbi:MAG: hypothetical protein CSH36_06980 [Thalassolituus sp.]|nr:MAG: hypothetical protein CSH36_06980 [Thalassolituus sp.]
MTSEKHTPWYKEPMMLIVAGVPFAAVIWGGVMLSLALDSKDSLVSNSYYKDGMSYTQDKRFHEEARRLNVRGEIVFTESEIIVDISGDMPELPSSLQLQLIHPTLEERDTTLFLQQTPDGHYVTANDMTLPQKRNIWLTSPDQKWRVTALSMIEAGKKIQTVIP